MCTRPTHDELMADIKRLARGVRPSPSATPHMWHLAELAGKSPAALLREALDHLGPDSRDVATMLMGIDNLTSSLTKRRDTVAKKLSVSIDTVKRRIESTVLRDLVDQILIDVSREPVLTEPPKQIADFNSVTMRIEGNLNGDLTINQSLGIQMPAAVAIVRHESNVLLVRRKMPYGALDWQFPAGIVKPDESPMTVAVQETEFETGIVAEIVSPLGRRAHPITGIELHYFAAVYVSGTVNNLDPRENREARWVPIGSLSEYVPLKQVYGPVLEYLSVDT